MVRVLDLQARHPEAFDHATQALRLAEPDDAAAVADGYTALAKQQLRLGRLADALVSGAGAAERYRRLQNREGLADILSTMGRAELGLGRHGAALMYLGEAVELDMALGDAYWAARTLTGMAEAYEAAGDLPRAAECRDATLRLSDSRPW